MKTKLHFLHISSFHDKKMMTVMPGQVLGRTPIRDNALVTDKRSGTCVQNARAKYPVGTVFYTTTLKRATGKYTAADIVALSEDDNVFLDAKAEFEKFTHNK